MFNSQRSLNAKYHSERYFQPGSAVLFNMTLLFHFHRFSECFWPKSIKNAQHGVLIGSTLQ